MAHASIFSRFRRHTDGVSAVEFAIVFPVLILLMLGGTQLVGYINAVRKVEAAASSMSEMLSQTYNPSDPAATTVYVTTSDLHFAYDQTMVVFPYLLKDAARQNVPWYQDITIDFASIQFVANGNVCTALTDAKLIDQSGCYVAKVVWTTTGTSGNNARPCGLQQPTTSSFPDNGKLPSNIFGAGSVIAVDVVFNFVPTFGSKFFGARRIARSVYVQPRYASLIDFNIIGNDGIATKCV